uniref:tumor protein p63-regulated gene 1-like protein isoform X1 n=1 Tax=Myxine glutinosa TaxID=7769 RepID=UPI00358E3E9D
MSGGVKTPEHDIDLGSDSEGLSVSRGVLVMEEEEEGFKKGTLSLSLCGVLGDLPGRETDERVKTAIVVETVSRSKVQMLRPKVEGECRTPTTKDFFVFRPGCLEQAVADIQVLLVPEQDGNLESVWLLLEVDHWNSERERLVLLTQHSLLVCKYDFVALACRHVRRIPLYLIEQITTGKFSFPSKSLSRREGIGLQVQWDRTRQPSLLAKWNPWSSEIPYTTFAQHPMVAADHKMAAISQLSAFGLQLQQAIEQEQAVWPVAGSRLSVCKGDIHIETYLGLVSLVGNKARLGYAMVRGPFGF